MKYTFGWGAKGNEGVGYEREVVFLFCVISMDKNLYAHGVLKNYQFWKKDKGNENPG